MTKRKHDEPENSENSLDEINFPLSQPNPLKSSDSNNGITAYQVPLDSPFILPMEKPTIQLDLKYETDTDDSDKEYEKNPKRRKYLSKHDVEIIHPVSKQSLIVQLPMLHRSHWKTQTEVLKSDNSRPLGNNYRCLRVQGNAVQQPQIEIFDRYMQYFQFELGCDFLPYSAKIKAPDEVYFIVSDNFRVCIGFCIFQKDEPPATEYFSTIAQKYVKYEKRGVFNHQMESSFFKQQIEAFDKRFQETGDPECIRKIDEYMRLSFFSNAKPVIPTDKPIELFELSAVWIHPTYRRNGFLSALFPVFQEKYKVFSITHPSDEQKKWLEEKGINHYPNSTRNFLVS